MEVDDRRELLQKKTIFVTIRLYYIPYRYKVYSTSTPFAWRYKKPLFGALPML